MLEEKINNSVRDTAAPRELVMVFLRDVVELVFFVVMVVVVFAVAIVVMMFVTKG